MTNLISGVISLFSRLQVKRFLAVVFAGALLLTTHVDAGRSNPAIGDRADRVVHQSDSQRPKTTGEWNREADEKASLGERVQDITEDSAEALKDFGKVYPRTAQRSGRELRNNTSQND